MKTFLGIDAGTTNIKAVLIDERDGLLDSASAPVVVRRPFEGACEIDMGELWTLLCGVTTQLRGRNPDAWGMLAGVGIAAQGDGMWPVTRDGAPAGPAILWNDTRCRGFDDVDMDEIQRYVRENSSTPLFAGALPVLMKWVRQNDRPFYDRIHRVAHCKDWLNFRLTGRFVSDYSDFSSAGINIFSKAHIPGLYDRLGIPEAKRMLPELVPPTEIIGAVTAEASMQCGIPAGLPVAAGMMDVVATIAGAGVTEPGDGCTILGTTLCNEILIDAGQVNIADQNGSALASIYPDRFVRVMAALSGNATIDWAKSVLAPDLGFLQLENELEKVPPGSRGILYHPYVAGERAPFRNPFACGGFYGLTTRHTRFDMMRAAYEGMALSVRDCFEALPKTRGRIYLSGGGAVSDFTCRLIAGALDKEIVRPRRKELAARGAVTALKLGLGLPLVGQTDDRADVFRPNRNERAAFDALYPQFCELRGGMERYWKQRRIFCDL